MYFNLINIIFSFKEKHFEFILFGIADDDDCNSLFSIYYYEGEWKIDLFWKRILGY